MRRNLSLGILVAVMVYATITVISFFSEKEEIEEPVEPLPKIFILPPPEPLDLHPLHDNLAKPKFEIKIQNEVEDEVLEVVATLADAKEYIKEYGQYHEDLFVYDIKSKELVLKSN